MQTNPSVLATTRVVVENARYVTIDQARVAAVAEDLAAHSLAPTTFDCERHLCGTDPSVANFVLVVDTLNFSFWPDPGQQRWRVRVGDETLDGYWALVASVRRAVDEGVSMLSAEFLRDVSSETLAHIFRGDGAIPLLEERAEALREVGRGLLRRDAGQFANTIARANNSALRLVALLADEFSSFADTANYGGRPVHFFKRAQICCGDLHGASQGAAWGQLTDLDQLTAFADYKVPQVLRRLGILVYAEALARTVDQRIPLPAGDDAEIEIRAATIWGVEYLRRALRTRGVELRAFELDWHLWELGQTLPADTRPYHLTRTIFY